jgi:hypothetical protein
MNVTSNAGEMTALVQKIRDDMGPAATWRALDRTRSKIRNQTRQAIAVEYKIPSRIMRARIFNGASKRSTRKAMRAEAIFKIGQWVIPVQRLGKVTERKKGGVSYPWLGGRTYDKNAFLLPERGDAVFYRVGQKKLPIRKKSVAIDGLAARTLTRVATPAKVREIYEQEFESTMKFRVDKELAKWRRAN